MSARYAVVAVLLGVGLLVVGGCQQGVARDEFDRLKTHDDKMMQENAQLRTEWEEMKANQDRLAAAQAAQPPVGPAAEFPKGNNDFDRINKSQLPKGTELVNRNGNPVIRIEGALVNYGPGKASLTPDGKQAMDRVALLLNRDFSDRVVVIEGHTDSDPINRTKNLYKSNWELGMKRATEVVNYLELKGVEPKRIRATSYGEYQPIADNGSSTGKAKNRRVEIVVLPQGATSLPATSAMPVPMSVPPTATTASMTN